MVALVEWEECLKEHHLKCQEIWEQMLIQVKYLKCSLVEWEEKVTANSSLQIVETMVWMGLVDLEDLVDFLE